MRCGIYVRVSTDDQKDNGYSIDSQLRMIKMKKKVEYIVTNHFKENGKSIGEVLEILFEKESENEIRKMKKTLNNFNKYGLLKFDYIKKYNDSLYQKLKNKNELDSFLLSVGNKAREKFDYLMKIFIKYDYEFDKNLKETNEVFTIKRMDIYEKIAEEIVLNEFIYK